MTQELTDIRTCILEGRYNEALMLVDELEGMSKKAILQNIESSIVRMLIHLIKNQVEQRLTTSWAASIRDSILKIRGLNIKENQTSYYIKQDEWDEFLEESLSDAIFTASDEVANGAYNPRQLQKLVDKTQIVKTASSFLNLIYSPSSKNLRDLIYSELLKLPGGEEWDREN
ncbi:MAG: DUF29 family protein [Hormoscilla sp. GUM202]|nr:DUF29 family protein [Hormoscilla sp. GUM202]